MPEIIETITNSTIIVDEGLDSQAVIEIASPTEITVVEAGIAGPKGVDGLTGGPGPSGPQGNQGPTGEQGPVGMDLTYTHNQDVPAATWTIVHNLGKMPAVVVADSSGAVVEGGMEFINTNSLRVSFQSAFSGKAYLN